MKEKEAVEGRKSVKERGGRREKRDRGRSIKGKGGREESEVDKRVY